MDRNPGALLRGSEPDPRAKVTPTLAEAGIDKHLADSLRKAVEEIAEVCGCHKDTVSEVCRKMADLPKSDKAAAEHAVDFEVPIYNVCRKVYHPGFFA